MAEINASIPLAFAPTQAPPQGLNVGAAATTANALTQLRQQAQQIKTQNALRSIFANPANLDPSGGLTAPAMREVMGVDPAVGMKLEQQNAELASTKTQLYGQKIGVAKDRAEQALVTYRTALANGVPASQALALGQATYTAGRDSLKSSGLYSPDEINRISPAFDPAVVAGFVTKAGDLQAQQDRAKAGERQDKIIAIDEARDKREGAAADRLTAGLPNWTPEMAKTSADEYRRTGKMPEGLSPQQRSQVLAALPTSTATPAKDDKWVVVTDPEHKDEKGNTVPAKQYRYNPDTAQSTTLDAKPYTPSGMAKIPGGTQASAISDDAADLIADQVLAGNRMAVSGLARNAASVTKVNDAIARKAKAQGLSGADIAAKQAEFAGMMSGERTLNTRAVNMEMAANEVNYMAPLALQASQHVNRSQYPALNAILLASEKGTGGEDVVRFGLAVNSLIYMYAKFLNPNGIPTDADKAKATDILSTAWSKGQFSTAIDQIQKEIQAGQSGIKTTKGELRDSLTHAPKDAAAGSSATEANIPPAPKGVDPDLWGHMTADERKLWAN